MNTVTIARPAIRGLTPPFTGSLGHRQPKLLDLCVTVDRVASRFQDYWIALIYEPESEAILGWDAQRAYCATFYGPCTKTIGEAVADGPLALAAMKWGWSYRVFTSLAGDPRFIDGLNAQSGMISHPAFPAVSQLKSDRMMSEVAERISWLASDFMGGYCPSYGDRWDWELKQFRRAASARISDYNEPCIGVGPLERWLTGTCAKMLAAAAS